MKSVAQSIHKIQEAPSKPVGASTLYDDYETITTMLPLLDSYGRTHNYLRISVTDRCNLRCVYCMPAEGIVTRRKEEILTFDEIVRVADLFARMGVTKLRITGGEPLVRKDLAQLISRLAQIEGIRTVGMTTNGVLLHDHVGALKSAGLSSLNISLDTLRRDRFERITLRQYYDQVFTGIAAARERGFAALKLNVVVMNGVNDDEIVDFVDFIRDTPINVRFIEYMPFKNNQWNPDGFLPFAEMKKRIEAKYELQPLPLEKHDVAKDFALAGYEGRVSFITSMSCDFCDRCNRIRLLADGSLKSCLFYASEATLRDALRTEASDTELESIIRNTVQQKPLRHPDMIQLSNNANSSMIEIGG